MEFNNPRGAPQISRLRDQLNATFNFHKKRGRPPNADFYRLGEEEASITLPNSFPRQPAQPYSRWLRTRVGESRVGRGSSEPDSGTLSIFAGKPTFNHKKFPGGSLPLSPAFRGGQLALVAANDPTSASRGGGRYLSADHEVNRQDGGARRAKFVASFRITAAGSQTRIVLGRPRR